MTLTANLYLKRLNNKFRKYYYIIINRKDDL